MWPAQRKNTLRGKLLPPAWVNPGRTQCMIGTMHGRGPWVGNPVRAAAASVMLAALWCARPQPCAAQALNIAGARPEWGADAAIESDLLRENPGREPHKKPLRVLLVGNSYTKFNLLHVLLSRVADGASGPRMHVDVEARGGYSLRMHLKSRTALIKIRNGHYSHVVLQGHSLSAVDHPDELAEDAERFNAAITASGSRTVLYETWARKPNTSLYRKHGMLRGFDDMVQRIDTAYSGIARQLHVGLAPIGSAFVRAWRTDPGVPLWGSDGSHPTLAGSYMAACVLYGAISGRDPRESSYAPYQLDARLAEQIRAVAAASLSAIPNAPGGALPVPMTVAATSGSSAQPASKSARTAATSASAKSNRSAAKAAETGRVAASIAAVMGRAPGEVEVPFLSDDDASAVSTASAKPQAKERPRLIVTPVKDGPADASNAAFVEEVLGPDATSDQPLRLF